MKSLFFFFLLIFSLHVFGNGNDFGNIQGIVSTADGQAAPNVSVLIKNTGKGTITDEKGNFEIKKIKPGSYIVVISLVGYIDSSLAIDIKPNEIISLKVQLKATYAELQTVIVEARSHPDYVATKPSESLRLNLPLIEIPQNIAVITQRLFAEQGLLSMTEAIRNVSGIQKTYGGLNDYSLNIRGTDATFNVFRNGVGGAYWWNQQEDIAMLEKTEFIKGPAGFMISMAEPGGIINNVTKQPVKERIANINAGFGSYKMIRLTADLGGTINKSGKLSYRFNAGIQNQERAFQYSKFSKYFVCVAVKYEPSEKTSITAEYNNMYGKTLGNNDGVPSVNGKLFSLPRNFAVADANTDKLIATDKSYRIQVKHSFNDNWHLNAQIGYLQGTWGGYMLLSDFTIPIINDTLYRYAEYDDVRNYAGVAQAFVDGKFFTGQKVEHKVLLGFDFCNHGVTDPNGNTSGEKRYGLYLFSPQYYISQDSLRNVDISENFRYYSKWAAIYVQDHIKIAGKLVVTLAGHFTHASDSLHKNGQVDKNRTYYNVFTPRAGLTWLFSDNLSAYALYDQCFRSQFGNIFLPQPIKPLTGYNIEAGMKGYFFNKKLGLNLSFYNIVKNNTLTTDPQHPDYVIEKGQITSKGIELDLNGNITPAFSVNANYSYTDATITKDDDPNNIGLPNFGTPKHYGNCWLKYKLLNGKLNNISFAVGYQYMGKRSAVETYNPDPATRFLPTYNLLDAAVSYSNEKFNISLNVYNITNINYATTGYFNTDIHEWRYTPGEPVNFRLSVGVNLVRNKKDK